MMGNVVHVKTCRILQGQEPKINGGLDQLVQNCPEAKSGLSQYWFWAIYKCHSFVLHKELTFSDTCRQCEVRYNSVYSTCFFRGWKHGCVEFRGAIKSSPKISGLQTQCIVRTTTNIPAQEPCLYLICSPNTRCLCSILTSSLRTFLLTSKPAPTQNCYITTFMAAGEKQYLLQTGEVKEGDSCR